MLYLSQIINSFTQEGLNDQNEMKKITAHCEEIYSSFRTDYKTWQKKYNPRLDVIGINKKWKYFRNPTSVQQEQQQHQPQPEPEKLDKNYNHIVNDIVQLTGYHSSKNDFDVLLELGRCRQEAQAKTVPNSNANNTADDEGPRTLPAGFSLAPLENRFKHSTGPESAFVCSRETSKDPCKTSHVINID